ncbi:PKD domain-containing protein [Blastococcus sp. CT_GayMR16]|uniref:PKD domain-containing protein n=1 Tax=Blastococcus sp. CT_GayMR16 TaxID=2559607 RepID=UPI001ADD856C|nr:PKD domain-containing protein [Blastococcus sp. CT_GayMR16]
MTAVVLLLASVTVSSAAQGAAEPGVVHFTAVGDYGSSADTSALLDRMSASDPDLNLALGDMSYAGPGSEPAWCDYVTSHVGTGFPVQLISGDNESSGQHGHINNFSACLPNQLPGLVGTYGRQWYVDVPQDDPLVRFVMISPALEYADGTWSYAAGTPRYNWTAAAIDGARATGVPWVVVGAHEPCIALGLECTIGGDLLALLLSKRVDLVLHGHQHIYGRTHQLALGANCPVVQGAYDPDCVVDPDGQMRQGAGTVLATVGVGGRSFTTLPASDSETAYFATISGGNRNPAYGYLDVRATEDDLRAQFVATTGTLTDSFTIDRGTPPPNTAPTAAFTSSASGLTATFDGRGSFDDGQIASYAWNFGDGGTTTGPQAQPQHLYAAAGTYDVTLTVTDGAGLTGTVTHPVTVTTPPPASDFVADAFDRSVTNGLGTADVGGPWSISGTAANFTVSGGTGRITSPSVGQLRSAWLGATTRSDTDLRMTFSLDKVPTGSGLYLDVVGRRVSLNNEYRARLVMAANGRITVQLTALKGSGNPVAIGTAVTLPTSITYSAGSQLNVRMQVTGTNPTTVRLKVWPVGAAEPTAWQTTATDTYAALQNPGAVGMATYLSGSATNAPVVVRIDALGGRPT